MDQREVGAGDSDVGGFEGQVDLGGNYGPLLVFEVVNQIRCSELGSDVRVRVLDDKLEFYSECEG